MNEIYEKLAEAGRLAASVESTLEFDDNAHTCDVYEVWSHNDSGNVVARFLSPNISNWLRSGDRSEANPGHTLLLRLVLVTVKTTEDAKKTVILEKAVHDEIIETFGLNLANEYFKGTVTSVTAFPKITVEPGAEVCCYALNHAPKLAATWSQRRYTGEAAHDKQAAIQGIIYMTEDSKKKNRTELKHINKTPTTGFTPAKVLRRLLSSPFCVDLYSSSMTPALLLAMQMGFEIDVAQSQIKGVIRSVEDQTGYHTFKSRVAATRQEKLGQLAVQASGSATKLASVERKSISMQKLLKFIVKELDKDGAPAAERAGLKVQELLRHHVGVLEERLEMQMLDARYTMKRVDIQINAIFNMMTQEDSMNSIQLAESTHQIAHASYRDSSSMKTLAIVTMFFLPGSFVSALFSMPMFEWDKANPSSIGVGLLPQFSLYWAITLPLTIVTFCLYFIWLWKLKRDRDREFDSVSRKSVDHSDGEEGEELVEERRLARKRRETTL